MALTCVRRSSAEVQMPGRRGHFARQSRPVLHCLLCTACPACAVVLLNALLCVHGAHECILSCGVLLMLACSFRFSLTTLAGLHVALLFELCVQAFPSGHVGPPATAGNKRRLGKGLQQEVVEVVWAEQFQRGGGLSGACYGRMGGWLRV